MSGLRFHILSLGCAKNTVDSASMARLLEQEGQQAAGTPEEAEVLIVNTCGFIGPAREESLDALRQLAAGKREGQYLIAAGCLTQRLGQEVAAEVPGLDAVLGTRRWMDIVEVVERVRARSMPEPLYHLPEAATVGRDERGVIRAAVSGGSAYLKIADGCRRPCAFCAIPLIKGTAVSRPMETILKEARVLEAEGVRELILIAQDTTDYGHDLGMKEGLATLLERLVEEAPGIDWIRVLYAYPGYVTDRLIEVMASHERILPYLDMPLQHAHPGVLRSMKRPANLSWVHSTLARMREAMPLDFVEEVRFDRVGVFTFSHEPGTASAALGDPIAEAVKEERRGRLMALQQAISLDKNQAFVGRTLEVLIEGTGDGISVGRSYRDAPEIDGMVLIQGAWPTGELVPVRITGASVYDLTGEVLDGGAAERAGSDA